MWCKVNGFGWPGMASTYSTDSFARSAYHVLVEEKRYSAKDIARTLGMKYATFHARLIGRVPFRPEEIVALLHVVPDIRLADALLAASPFLAVPKTPPAADGEGETIRIAIEAVNEAARALAEIERAEHDGGVNGAQHRGTIDTHLLGAERALAQVRTRLHKG